MIESYPGNWSGAIMERVGRWNQTRRELRTRALTAIAAAAETEMKSLAPWRNRTGRARQSLHVAVRASAVYPAGARQEITLTFMHGVFYGKYLEHRWAGKYAIIGPTVQRWRPVIRRALRNPRDFA